MPSQPVHNIKGMWPPTIVYTHQTYTLYQQSRYEFMTQKKFDTKCSGVENIIQTKHDMQMDNWLNDSNTESLLCV